MKCYEQREVSVICAELKFDEDLLSSIDQNLKPVVCNVNCVIDNDISDESYDFECTYVLSDVTDEVINFDAVIQDLNDKSQLESDL